MEDLDFVGQTLDGKYEMTRELGRGGMGTVYLATHLGTERPVAVKIISPQFMERVEFVERFRREARAAGRLRHPNVVNVTDFGFAETPQGQVAYLVMEYLDGCTLGEILDEERNLPVPWTLDILEQVCSAVHEAHEMGIIHRDLKPDNIWLEPNQRGGYTVKVLDFGIAKLEEHDASVMAEGLPEAFKRSVHTMVGDAKTTFAGDGEGTQVDGVAHTVASDGVTIAAQTSDHGTVVKEAGTLHLAPMASEGQTAILDDGDISLHLQETIGTRMIMPDRESGQAGETTHRTTGRSLYDSKNSAELTRVGAVLGTPLYMSPEQCRGEHLDPRSDIYSLGVIAYQMLSGRTPFEGDFKDVMESHKTIEPPPIDAKKVRRKMKRAIHSALNKDPDERPQTAEAFATVMRSRSEGIFGLLRRAMVIYSEHLLKFLALTAFFSLPMILLTLVVLTFSYLRVSGMVSETVGGVVIGVTGIFLSLTTTFCTNLMFGTIAWVVTQYLAVPLRPIRLRPALTEARKKWKRIAGTGLLTAILPFVVCIAFGIVGFIVFALLLLLLYPITGTTEAIPIAGGIGAFIFGFIGFFGAYIAWILVAPVVMMENVRVVEALRRSRALVKRSWMTSFGAVCILFLLPAIIAGSIAYVVNVSAKAFDPKPAQAPVENVQKTGGDTPPAQEPPAAANPETPADLPSPNADEPAKDPKPKVSFGWGKYFGKTDKVPKTAEMDMRDRVRHTVLESLTQIIWLPIQIFVFSFSGIIIALLYLKTRLAGGESMNDLLERFEDDDRPRKKWQERVRQRLIQSGRIPSKP